MRYPLVRLSHLPSIYALSHRAISALFTVLIAVVLLGINRQANAIATNPIATQCASNQVRDQLSNADYLNLLSNNRSNKTSSTAVKNISGVTSSSIPLKIKMTKTESGTNTAAIVNESFSSFGSNDNNSGFFAHQTFNNKVGEAQANITLEFFDSRSSVNNTPIYLSQVGISAFDIDDGGGFDDYVIVTGINKSGATIEATFQNIGSASDIAYGDFNDTGFKGLYTSSGKNCTEHSLDTRCQGAVSFDEPVKSVTVIYTNRKGRLSSNKETTRQGMEFRLDNYCYAPPRVFSGIVFNDNGGANDATADDRDANLNSTTGIYANTEYFNGLFNLPERGITGSTVTLVDSCTNPTQTYATKTLSTADANTGRYTFTVEQVILGSQTNLCLIETGNTAAPIPYSIRTTSDKIPITIAPATLDYSNNNFGRVIAKNAALVLEKEQFAHNCSVTDLKDSSIAYTKDPISGNTIKPDQCIAYKITATNRAHISADRVIIKDTLQKTGEKGAQVTSYLATPTRTSAPKTVGYSDALNIGDNGEIKTVAFDMPKRTKQSFYFNTRYGSSQTN